MTKLFTSIFLSLGLFISSCTIIAAPQKHIGMVIFTQGPVEAIDKQNKRRSLKRRSKIYLHDKIITKKNCKTQIRLNDDSIIIIQASSEFYVSEFFYDKRSPRNSKYVGNIVKGALINISGQGKPENYTLNSPLVTIAFRGTSLATKLISKRNILTNQEVMVFKGYVTLKNNCKNVIGPCEPTSINIGVGQKANAAVIDRMGKIKATKSSELFFDDADGLSLDTMLIKQVGGITVRCKGKK